MTREQLDAIRARVEAATPGPWEAGTAFCCPDCGWVDGPKRTVCPVYEGTKRTHTLDANDAEFIAAAREDVPALLAEVERLNTEIEAKTTQNVALVGMNGRLQQEVERLTTVLAGTESALDNDREYQERLKGEVAEMERSAFKRGVAAMREAAAKRCEVSPIHGEKTTTARKYADAVRDLPDPEDTP